MQFMPVHFGKVYPASKVSRYLAQGAHDNISKSRLCSSVMMSRLQKLSSDATPELDYAVTHFVMITLMLLP